MDRHQKRQDNHSRFLRRPRMSLGNHGALHRTLIQIIPVLWREKHCMETVTSPGFHTADGFTSPLIEFAAKLLISRVTLKVERFP